MLLEGTLFGDTYRLIRLVGEGAMGAVYEATHARLEGRYVIKVLQPSLSRNAESLALFHLEARITSLLQHPNIVQVVDHNTTAEGIEYLVMEYLAGETLSDRLRRTGALPLDAVVGIVEQIAAGLAAAHAHGIVHRDLKPDNVFLVPVEGRQAESVKILDFGISKVRDPSWGVQAPEGTLLGTPLYMSPEQVEGRVADVDAATDQFALAVIAYEMLTGRNPFQADSISDVFSRVLHRDPAPMGIGRDVELVVRRGLAKSSRQRFACVTDFSDALAAATAGRARESQRSAKIAYAAGKIASLERKRSSRRRKWGTALAAVVAVNMSIYLIVGGAAHRPASPAPNASSVGSDAPRQVRLPVVEDIQPVPEIVQPVIVPAPVRRAARARWSARDRRPSESRWTFLSTTSIPRSAATPFPVDDDATMPASEP